MTGTGLAPVIPLQPYQNRLSLATETATPEPAQLYHLTVLTFVLHTPQPDDTCSCCGNPWPCPQVRLAFRLREGF